MLEEMNDAKVSAYMNDREKAFLEVELKLETTFHPVNIKTFLWSVPVTNNPLYIL